MATILEKQQEKRHLMLDEEYVDWKCRRCEQSFYMKKDFIEREKPYHKDC